MSATPAIVNQVVEDHSAAGPGPMSAFPNPLGCVMHLNGGSMFARRWLKNEKNPAQVEEA
jgi:hypothetical protein